MKTAEFSQARDYAFRLLKVRPRSCRELEKRLTRRDFPKQIRDQIIGDLKEKGYLNDEEFARMWINSRVATKPTGPYRLWHELRQKGIEREIIQRSMAEEYEAKIDQHELAREGARVRLRVLKDLPFGKKRRRLLAYLTRRGFQYEVAKEVVGEVLTEE